MRLTFFLVLLLSGCSSKGINDFYSEPPKFLRGVENSNTRSELLSHRNPTQTLALLGSVELADLSLVAAAKDGIAHRVDVLEPKTNSPLFILYEIPGLLSAINYRSKTFTEAVPNQQVTFPGLSFGLTMRQLFALLVGRVPDNFIETARLYKSGNKVVATHHRLGTAVFENNQLLALEIPERALIEYSEVEADKVPREIIIHDLPQDLSLPISIDAVSTEPINISRFKVKHPSNFTRVTTLSLD